MLKTVNKGVLNTDRKNLKPRKEELMDSVDRNRMSVSSVKSVRLSKYAKT